MSGSASMVPLTPSSTRPPWLETMIRVDPRIRRELRILCARMPLSTSFVFTVSRRRLIVSQVMLVTAVPLDAAESRCRKNSACG